MLTVSGWTAHGRVDFAGPGGGDFGLRQPAVRAAKQHGAGKVRVLDAVAVGHEDVAHAQQGQVLEDFVPQRTGADDEEFRRGQSLLVPPTDQSQTGEAVLIGRVFDGKQVRHAIVSVAVRTGMVMPEAFRFRDNSTDDI